MASSESYPAFTPESAAVIRDVRYHSMASLTFLLWNSLVTFDGEVQYIWTMRNKNPFKWTYLFLRYVVVLAHVTHNILMGRLADGSNPHALCKFWRAYINSFILVLPMLLELILMSRVIAFYNRSKRITLLLSFLILIEVADGARLLWMGRVADFRETCLLMRGSKSHREHSILVFTNHCVLISLTAFKYFFALRAGWGRTPLVSLVIRDIGTVYALVFFLFVTVIALRPSVNAQGVALVFWVTALFSVIGCYMILSMERLAREESAKNPRSTWTSQLSIGTSLQTYVPSDYSAASRSSNYYYGRGSNSGSTFDTSSRQSVIASTSGHVAPNDIAL